MEEKNSYSDERIAQLRLIRTKGIGPKTFFELLEIHKTALNAIEFIKKDKIKDIIEKEEVLKEIQEAEKLNARYIFWDQDEYPKLLRQISCPPPVLNVLGDISCLNMKDRPLISIVGSRDASILGKKFSNYISKELALRGFVIISGMANGIDSAAHESIIDLNFRSETNENSIYKTIAVIGSGLQNPYPSKIMMQKILNSGGGVISEFSFFETPKKENFPMRNRILSGISHATLVVEAKERSGSILTAKYAIDQGRLVFAVPGFPFDEKSFGTNRLIKDGAILTQDIFDILEEMNQFSLINHSSKNKKQAELFEENIEKQNNDLSIEEVILNLLDQKIPSTISDIMKILEKDYNFSVVTTGVIRILSSMESEDIIRRCESSGGFLKN